MLKRLRLEVRVACMVAKMFFGGGRGGALCN